jgi:hypothetical protein
MKLLKYYSLKQAKSNEIIFFTFPFIYAHSKIWKEKRQLRNRLFKHEGHLFLSEIREKGQNMTILGYSCSLQSSLYTKSHRFTLKSLIFCPKTIATLVFETLNLSKLYPKKGTSDKSNEK